MRQSSKQVRGKRGGSTSKKMSLSVKQINTQLYEPDQLVFDNERARYSSDADLLRHIVHEWAKKKRLGGTASDEMGKAVRELHEKIVSEQLAPVKELLNTLLGRIPSQAVLSSSAGTAQATPNALPGGGDVSRLLGEILESLSTARNEIVGIGQTVATASAQQGEQLSLHEAMAQRLMALGRAHFMLSGQSFASLWATLDFIQRYIAEPTLKSLENEDPFTASLTHRDDARKEGLGMVIEMCKLFQFPGSLEMQLVSPPGEG